MKRFLLAISALLLISSGILSSQTCQWAQKLAGAGIDDASCIAIDHSGNIFIAGYFGPSTFTLNNGISLANSGDFDAYIAKYNTAGVCQWARKIAGTKADAVYSIAVDKVGDAYIVGYFGSPTLTFTDNLSLTNSGEHDGFFAKYNSSGDCLWAQKISSTRNDEALCVDVDTLGYVYVSGIYFSGTLNFSNGAALTNTGYSDLYIAKFNTAGQYQWAQKIAGTGYDESIEIAVTANGTIFATGHYTSNTVEFNNGYSLSLTGASRNSYLAKYTTIGECQWAQLIAGNDSDTMLGLECDSLSNVYLTGHFLSSILNFNTGISLTLSGTDENFLAKYDSLGVCKWAQGIIGSNNGSGFGDISIDPGGNIYVVGDYTSATVTFNNGISLTNGGNHDGYVSKYNPTGTCQWAVGISGTSAEYAKSVLLDNDNMLYVCGIYSSPTATINNGITLSNSGHSDAFITQIFNQPSSIDEYIDAAPSITIYPNPSIDYFSIELPNDFPNIDNLFIYNSIGACVFNTNNMELNSASGKISIPVTDLPVGAYKVILQTRKGTYCLSVAIIR